MGRKYRMGVAAAHRQGSSYYMAHGALQCLRVRTMLHGQIYVDFGNVYVAHDAAHGELLRIRQGRGGSPSLCNSRRAGEHSVVLLRGLPLGGQFDVIGVLNGGGISGFHIRMIFLAYQLTDQRIEK